MPVASLIIGIMGVMLFCWVGPLLGATWAGIAVANSLAGEGPTTVVTWPIWLVGLTVGLGFPLVGVVLGIRGLKQEESRGICLGGIIVGSIAAIFGLIGTLAAVGFFTVVDGLSSDPGQIQKFQQLQQQLADPDALKQIQDKLDQAARQLPAQPAPDQPMEPMKPMKPIDPVEPPKPAEPPPQPEKDAPSAPATAP